MYYKIVSGGIVMDACDGLRYVRWQEKNRIWLSCGESGADGILGYRGDTIWLLEGTQPIDGYTVCTVSEITEEEFDALREELDAGGEIIDPDGDTPAPDTPTKTRLQALEEQVAKLTSMEAKDNIAGGACFVLHDEVYRASEYILKGSEIRPGRNCMMITLSELLGEEGE